VDPAAQRVSEPYESDALGTPTILDLSLTFWLFPGAAMEGRSDAPDTHRGVEQTDHGPQFEHAKRDMEPLNIAVIGAEGVGKSTFIQHLRRAPRPSALNITTLRHEVDGVPYLVTLVELDLEGIELDPNQPVHWPKQIGGHMVPRMDGALILYDAVNEETTREVPPIMGESHVSS